MENISVLVSVFAALVAIWAQVDARRSAKAAAKDATASAVSATRAADAQERQATVMEKAYQEPRVAWRLDPSGRTQYTLANGWDGERMGRGSTCRPAHAGSR